MAAAALTLGLSGCISFGPKVPDQLITLTAHTTAPPGDITGTPGRRAVVVLDPNTERNLDLLRVPVQVSPATIAYMKDISWVEKPARQFRALLAETIRTNNRTLVFEGISADTGQQRILSGQLTELGYDAPSGSVVVRYDAVLTDVGGMVTARRFEARVPGIAPKAVVVGPAINQAANQVAGEVAAWVAQVPEPPVRPVPAVR